MPFPGIEWWIRLGFLNQNYISEFVTEDLWGRPQPTEWKFAKLVYIALSVIIDNTFLEKLPFSLFWKFLQVPRSRTTCLLLAQIFYHWCKFIEVPENTEPEIADALFLQYALRPSWWWKIKKKNAIPANSVVVWYCRQNWGGENLLFSQTEIYSTIFYFEYIK